MRCHSLCQDHLRGEGHEPYEEPPKVGGWMALALVVAVLVVVTLHLLSKHKE